MERDGVGVGPHTRLRTREVKERSGRYRQWNLIQGDLSFCDEREVGRLEVSEVCWTSM